MCTENNTETTSTIFDTDHLDNQTWRNNELNRGVTVLIHTTFISHSFLEFHLNLPEFTVRSNNSVPKPLKH